MDTGADTSILPVSRFKNSKLQTTTQSLYAANDSAIPTCGNKLLSMNLGLRMKFDFIIANVSKPILGADFLKHFGLVVDVKRRCLSDTQTKLSTQCASEHTEYEPVFFIQNDHKFKELLNSSKEVTMPVSYNYNNEPKTTEIACDVSSNRVRPFVTEQFRQRVFYSIHNLAHAGRRATIKQIAERFEWPGIAKDIAERVKLCLPC
ncbi:uncharacterized protein LOC119665541 [Teleopsis dalmanni]|uniref:uncharacterized protein LOC119665541 n=1 Tax=Teleopsis dalmanni TaxID=139649 RepID=UPI0018CC8EA9|nr:uncharacterized protein LOC119665541 [Teleopsis dalmanni]